LCSFSEKEGGINLFLHTFILINTKYSNVIYT
jgi:hypothetical protein